MQQLKELSTKFLDNALASTTKRNYQGAVVNYETFCRSHLLVEFPFEEETLILFVTYLATYSSYSNIKCHLAALRFESIRRTSSSPIKDFQKLYYVVRGIKRSQGNSRKRPLRAPITPTILEKIRSHLFSSTHLYVDKTMLWSAILTAFYGFLRVSEYTSTHKTKYVPSTTLLLSDLTIQEGRAKLNIKASKTDPFRQGVVIAIAENGSPLCPISALSEFLRYRIPTHGPLFRFHNGKFLTRSDVNKVLAEATGNLVNVSSHSLRLWVAQNG